MDLQNWDFLRLENRVEKLNRVRVATLTRSYRCGLHMQRLRGNAASTVRVGL